MPSRVTCPACRREQRIPDEALGKRIKCRFCAGEFVAGAISAEPPPPPAGRAATGTSRGEDALTRTRPARVPMTRPTDSSPTPGKRKGFAVPRLGRDAVLLRPSWPWYVFLPAVLPLGLPILTGGKVFWLVLGIVLAAACLGVALVARLPGMVRFGSALALAVGGYLGAAGNLAWPTRASPSPEQDQALEEGGHPADWQKFSDPVAGYSVLLPGTPQTQLQILPGLPNCGHWSSFVCSPGAEDVAYAVGTMHAGLEGLTPNQRLDAARQVVVEQMKGQLRGEKRVIVHRHPMRELEIDSPEKGVVVARVCFFPCQGGHHIYTLTVSGAKITPSAPQVKRFFESFTPYPNQPAIYKGRSAGYWVEQLQHREWLYNQRALQTLERMPPPARDAVMAELRAAKPALIAQLRTLYAGEGAAFALDLLGPEPGEVIPPLLPYLGVIGLRPRTCEMLAKLGADAVPPLVAVLKNPRGHHRPTIIHILGRMGPPARDAVPVLVELLKDPALCLEAAEALVRIGGPEARKAMPVLIQALKTGPFDRAKMLLGQLGPEAREAVPLLTDNMKKTNVMTWSVQSAQVLLQIEPNHAAARDELRTRLADKDPAVVIYAACVLLGRDPQDEAARAALAEGLRRHPGQLPREGVNRPTWAIPPEAVALLEEVGPAVKEAAAALGEFLLRVEDVPARRACIRVLTRLDPGNASAILIQLLEKDTASFDALAALRPVARETVSALILILKHQAPYLREYAADTLGQLGPAARDAVPALQEAARDEKDFVRFAAVQALQDIQGHK